MKRTKIVATIGPASENKTIMEKMMKAGMNVARLNFSHGTYEHHQMLIDNLRSVAHKLKINLALIQDLQGPGLGLAKLRPRALRSKKARKFF